MTAGQVTYFVVAARCSWTKYVAKAVQYILNGDTQARQMKINSILVDRWLKAINCFDPDADDNCLTSDQVRLIMDQIMKILGLCGDTETLDEIETECCNCLSAIRILNP